MTLLIVMIMIPIVAAAANVVGKGVVRIGAIIFRFVIVVSVTSSSCPLVLTIILLATLEGEWSLRLLSGAGRIIHFLGTSEVACF